MFIYVQQTYAFKILGFKNTNKLTDPIQAKHSKMLFQNQTITYKKLQIQQLIYESLQLYVSLQIINFFSASNIRYKIYIRQMQDKKQYFLNQSKRNREQYQRDKNLMGRKIHFYFHKATYFYNCIL
ncbi:unnamed protein product [Paramecium primaurelia]|uniref:Uncharacterized protein n=1 Tax=Paramecium primaurelia TaxID=5886 RepID=A0A8S1QQR2_PARPR|nr:unnamed protein product [Paramecium primaurelia]